MSKFTRASLLFAAAAFLLIGPGAAFAAPSALPSNPDPSSGQARINTPATPDGVARTASATDVENLNTSTYYATIAAALADPNTLDGHVLEVQVATHAEPPVNVNKSVTIQGQTGSEVVVPTSNTGNSGDARGWFLVTAPNVTVQNLNFEGTGFLVWQAFRVLSTGGGASFSHCDFTQIRYQASGGPYAGNVVVFYDCNGTVSDCTLSEIGRHGVFFFGTGCTAGLMERCTYTGKGSGDWLDYGCEIGGGAVATITDNTVTACEGVALSDGSTSAGVLVSTYFGPGTDGTLTGNFLNGNLDGVADGYDASDTSVLQAHNNDLSGNSDLGLFNTSGTVTADASANWWGSNDPVAVAAARGGLVDYTPWLDSGTDTDVAAGFQGDFSVLDVDDDSPQTGASSRIQEGINLVTASTVNVMPGTYPGGILINKLVHLLGAQAGNDARAPRGAESIVSDSVRLIQLVGGCAGSVIDGFTFSGGGSKAVESTSGPITGIQVLNNKFVSFTGVAVFLNDNGEDIDFAQNEFDGSSATGTSLHLDQDDFDGVHITDNDFVNNANVEGLFVDGNHNVGMSASMRAPLISGNLFDNNAGVGANLGRFAFVDGSITNNVFSNNAYDGLQGGIQNTTISGNTFDGNGRFGLALTGFGGSSDPTRGAQNCTITGNTFSNNADTGLLFSSSQYPGTISTNVANNNDFSGNATGAGYSGTESIDATCNWWNDLGGPNAPGNPSAGDAISGATIQYAPWLDGSIAGSPNCDQYGSNYVSANPTSDCITPSNPCKTVPIDFTRGDMTGARGVSVTFQLSSELELCVDEDSSIHQGTWLSGFGTTFQVYANGGGSYTVDQSILGIPCGITTGGQLFTIDVKASGSASPEDVGTITITQVTARDCDNGPIAGIPGPPASVTIDNNVPVAVASLSAAQQKTGNDTDGTTKINLSWTALASPGADDIEIYRAPFGQYPEYDDAGGAAPSVPASYPPSGPWTLAGTVPATSTGYADEPPVRDFWYYAAYVVDACGNVSPVSNMTGGTLDYHLGDVAPGGVGNNHVELADISDLGAHYGIALTHVGDPYNYLDVGPTSDMSVNGLPDTDDQIQFEDLILFAINYGQVSKPVVGAKGPDANAVMLTVPEQVPSSGTFEVAIDASSDGSIQGVSVPLTWNAQAVEPVGFREGDFAGSQGGRTLVASPKPGTVDAAVFGSTFRGTGELATVTFRVIGPGAPGIGLGEVAARDHDNHPVKLDLSGRGTPVVPGMTRLLPAAQNPFVGSAMVRYAMAEPGRVKIDVYGLDGRLVRTLVNGDVAAGEQAVSWDGRDAAGRSVASGAYLIRFRTARTDQTQRVVRLR